MIFNLLLVAFFAVWAPALHYWITSREAVSVRRSWQMTKSQQLRMGENPGPVVEEEIENWNEEALGMQSKADWAILFAILADIAIIVTMIVVFL